MTTRTNPVQLPEEFWSVWNSRRATRARARFEAWVSRGDGSGCWEWQGPRTAKGYGRMKIARHHSVMAHRIAWAVANEADPGDMFVLHSCDNPPCCNPAHLRLGTNQDNVADKVARGRAVGRRKLFA